MTNDILLEIVTNTNKNIEAFVNEHVGFDKNDQITFTKPTDIHEIRSSDWFILPALSIETKPSLSERFILPRLFL